ncbi:MAG: PPC domain-containing DNA-binding protein [bacterium]
MRWRKTEDGYIVRLEKGEEVLSTLTQFVRQQNIQGGTVQGLGAVKDLVLGIFDPHKKEYVKRTFRENLELGNLTGNISYVDGNPMLHCHVTAAGADLRAFAGHLFSAIISATGEFVINPFTDRITRVLDEEVGLNLLEV